MLQLLRAAQGDPTREIERLIDARALIYDGTFYTDVRSSLYAVRRARALCVNIKIVVFWPVYIECNVYIMCKENFMDGLFFSLRELYRMMAYNKISRRFLLQRAVRRRSINYMAATSM